MPMFLKKYFWDVDFSKLDYEKNPDYVIARIFAYFEDADREKIPKMIKPLDWEEVKKFFISEQKKAVGEIIG